jgi:hypothetical protein
MITNPDRCAESVSNGSSVRLRNHRAVTDDEAHAAILSGLRMRLGALADAHGAEFRETHDRMGHLGFDTVLELHPNSPGATPITVFPEAAHTTWVEFGLHVVDEIFTSPKHVPRAIDDVLEVVDAVTSGRARQRLWYSPTEPEPIGAQTWVQLREGGAWVPFQGWGRVPFRPLRRRYRTEDVQYDAYS